MKRFIALAAVLIAAGCATQQVHMQEPRRVVGTEEAVRIDAEITGDSIGPNVQIPITYAITNQRPQTIAIADLIPDSTYDAETRTVTVSLGTEVPGENFLPRLITIAPGEKKTFSTTARVRIAISVGNSDSPIFHVPNALRIKVNFLGDTKPFAELVDIAEKAVHDPQLADKIFPAWLEANEVVYTNTLPMRWAAMNTVPEGTGTGLGRPGRRGRRGRG